MNSSIKYQKSIDKLLDEVYLHYIQSTEFNGLPLSSVTSCSKDETKDETKDVLQKLIEKGDIYVLSSKFDSNPYIIRFGFPSIEEQIEYIQNYSFNEELVLYPSPSYLEKNRNVSELALYPFKKMMAIGYPQLKACFFEYNVLQHYAFDPRKNLKFNDYQGEIHSDADINSTQYINLKTFGIGRNKEDFVIVAFPRDLQNMSSMNQSIWLGHMIKDTANCKILKDYYDNLFNVSWNFPDTIYRAILKEIVNINDLTTDAFSKSLFRKTYSKENLEKFDILPFPSLESYNQFLLLLEKIVISNIDVHFFEMFMSIERDKGSTRGSLNVINEWITHINNSICDDILSPLKHLRKERQAPAHKIQLDDYANEYLSKQHSLCKSIYRSLHLLRCLLQTHPKLKNTKIRYSKTDYIEL